ncbi:molybdate ABC transporter substrate-binding protein [Plesiomonas sp.]|uniref:molybdate ABC transporter substrate-binding protein n=1 Tax=Plesiomonas sp. TaxID=2486279 RepID=UPI003F2D693F
MVRLFRKLSVHCANNAVRKVHFSAVVISVCTALISSSAVQADTLNIAVAANFKPTLDALAPLFARQSGHQLRITSASSGVLYTQIINGAPFDVLLSADTERPEKLEQEQRTVAGSRFTYAQGQLALWNIGEPVSLADPQAWRGRLAIANPRTAPYGSAAKAWLEQHNAWQSPTLTLITGANISQTYQFVDTGNANMGLVAYPNVLVSQPKGQILLLPAESYPAIAQQAVILSSSSHLAAAKQFSAFLRSELAKKLIREQGYLLP